MQLNQPIPPTPDGGQGQYDFIMNGNQKPPKSILPSGGSRKQRIIFVIGGALAILSVFAIVLALIFSSGGGDRKALTSLAATQTELIRVSDTITTKARAVETQNFAQTTTVTLTTGKSEITSYLSKQRVKISSKDLALGKNSKTDEALNTAEKAGRYDEEAVAILEKSLAAYKAELKDAYSKASTTKQKQLIQGLYDQADKLTKNQPTSS